MELNSKRSTKPNMVTPRATTTKIHHEHKWLSHQHLIKENAWSKDSSFNNNCYSSNTHPKCRINDYHWRCSAYDGRYTRTKNLLHLIIEDSIQRTKGDSLYRINIPSQAISVKQLHNPRNKMNTCRIRYSTLTSRS